MGKYYFNLPAITSLTIPQQAALNEPKPIALSGGPGTGKSVVSLWRHISNYDQNKKSLLLTFTSTLARYLSGCCANHNKDAASNVGRSLKAKRHINDTWSEIIIDEAQDLPNDYYNEIACKVSYGADDSQTLYPKCTKQEELKQFFPKNIDYPLDENFRSTQRIMQLAKIAFPDAYIPRATITKLESNKGELPVLLISGKINKFEDSNDKQDEAIVEIISALTSDMHNIAILVPLRKHVVYFETVLKDSKDKFEDFSIYYSDNERFPNGCEEIKNIHITTFKSAKGLEFDTVIIPNFDLKNSICKPEYKIGWNDYYVAVTRTRSNLYLFSSHDLPELSTVTEKQEL